MSIHPVTCRWDKVLPTSWQLMAVVVIFLMLGLTLHAEACLYVMVANIEGYPNSWVRVLNPHPGEWCGTYYYSALPVTSFVRCTHLAALLFPVQLKTPDCLLYSTPTIRT